MPEQITPIPLTIHHDGDQVHVHGSAVDLALLRSMGTYKTDRAALKHIQNIWGCDRDTAKVLLRTAREGEENR